MNMMSEMMKKMDADMKKQGMDMMKQCQDMMGKMDPDMKQQCMSMMDRCKNMMGNSTADAGKNDTHDSELVFTHNAAGSFEEVERKIEEDAKAIGLGLKKIYPFSKNLPEQQGFEVNEAASVYELCMPSLAADT